ncbi:MAG TPA: NAD(P)/FAD-dependent oxidoreductase [Thermoleophilaceae bacterium]
MSPSRPSFKVVGRRLAPPDHRLRDFLTRAAQPFEWVEAGTPEAERLLEGREVELPAVIDGDEVISGATVEGLVEAWRLTAPPSKREYELVIIGAGPAGLAAAVYAASDGLSTLLLDIDVPGGQASHTSMIENFFGFPEGIGGAELARLAGRQAERFGAELAFLHGVTGGHADPGGSFVMEVAEKYEVTAPTCIAAPGMLWRRLEVEGLDDLLGRGVYYGAGRSEAARCASDDVVVVGAGNSAGQAVMNLASAGARVVMVVRGNRLGKSMSGYLVDRIAASPLIDVRLQTEVDRVEDDGAGLAAVLVRSADGSRKRLPAKSLFLCLGGQPRTEWTAGSPIRTDPAGYLLTGPDLLVDGRRPEGWPLARDPLALETSVPGMFAAGDVRHGSVKRVAGAVGDGAMAVSLVHRWLDERLATGVE